MTTIEIPAPRFHPARPAPIISPKIESRSFWVAITAETAREKLDAGDPMGYLCLADNSYLTFAAYFQDILRYIKQTNALIDYYELEK